MALVVPGQQPEGDRYWDLTFPTKVACDVPTAQQRGGHLIGTLNTRVCSIQNPDSELLEPFVRLLERTSRGQEIESIEVFRNEIARSANPSSTCKFICLVAQDPLSDNPLDIVSGAYGSVSRGVLAIRYTATDKEWRGWGLSRELEDAFLFNASGGIEGMDETLIGVARAQSSELGYPLRALIGVCVDRSERFWNRTEIEPGNGMRRLYFGSSGNELEYFRPPLSWDKTGKPLTQQTQQHIQLAIAGYTREIPSNTVENVLRAVWNEWYVRPESDFDTHEAWNRHVQAVSSVLSQTTMQLRDEQSITLRSSEERDRIATLRKNRASPMSGTEQAPSLPHQMQDVCIQNEWNTLTSAVVSSPAGIPQDLTSNFVRGGWGKWVDRKFLSHHPELGPVDYELACHQHQELVNLLKRLGVEVAWARPVLNAPFQVFARDALFAIHDNLFEASLDAKHRKPESLGLTEIEQKAENFYRFRGYNLLVEGGDIIVLPKNVVLVGTGQITSATSYKAIRNILGHSTKCIRVPHAALHLGCALAPLPDGSAMFCTANLSLNSYHLLKPIFGNRMTPLNTYESRHLLSADMLWVDKKNVITHSGCELLNHALTDKGYDVHSVDISQLVRMCGGVRSLVAPLKRE